VRGVDADLERLQPVAVPVAFEGEGVLRGRDEAIEIGESGRGAFAEIGEEHAAFFDHGTGAQADVLAEAASLRFRRRLEAFARDVEKPAVERAAQAAVLEASIGEIGAAVRALPVDQSIAVLLVAEENEALAQHPNRLHRSRPLHLIRKRHRLPVAAQELPGGRARPHARHELVLFAADHPIPPARERALSSRGNR
jgi:hypothetical protein